MGFFDRLRGIDRRCWHVCYTCMTETGHDTVRAIFYSEGPPLLVLGRPLFQCPRCAGTNTKSFQALKEEHAESQLWGLERVVRQHPRSTFVVKAEAQPSEARPNVHELTTRQ
jgi:hypothetical protein